MKISKNYELGKFFNFARAKGLPIHKWFYYKESFSPQLVEIFVNDYIINNWKSRR